MRYMIVSARSVEVLIEFVQQAFGAPGDWGYAHPIGRALAAPEDA